MSGPLYSYKETFEETEKNRYRLFVSELGNHVIFEDDTWVCDKRIRSGSDPEKYKETVKYYTILRILQGDGVRTVRTRITKLNPFLKFCGQMQQENILQCSVLTAVHFKEYLEQAEYSVKTKNRSW